MGRIRQDVSQPDGRGIDVGTFPPSYFLPYLPIWMRRSFPDFIRSLLAEFLVIFSLAKPPSLTGVLITHLLCGLVLFTAQLFVAGDQLLKGAALNAVQIAELL